MFIDNILPGGGQEELSQEEIVAQAVRDDALIEELGRDCAEYLADSQGSETTGGPRPPGEREQAVGPVAKRAEGEGGDASSLDDNGQVVPPVAQWSRRQRRLYHRVRSCLTYWEGHQYQVAWVMLSTGEGGRKDLLARHHATLRKRIEHKWGFRGIQFFQVRTGEGHGVLHLLWAWRPRNGERSRPFFIPQGWLSEAWASIHGAPVVWITRYRPGGGSLRRVSRYLVAQYCADQSALEYVSWSWRTMFGFPLVRVWTAFKKMFSGQWLPLRIKAWDQVLRGGTFVLWDGGEITLVSMREAYKAGLLDEEQEEARGAEMRFVWSAV